MLFYIWLIAQINCVASFGSKAPLHQTDVFISKRAEMMMMIMMMVTLNRTKVAQPCQCTEYLEIT
jgi:hypothetical protein